MGLEASVALPAGGWECFQEEAAAEVRFERRLEGGEGVIHPNRCLGQGDTWQRDQAGVAAPG